VSRAVLHIFKGWFLVADCLEWNQLDGGVIDGMIPLSGIIFEDNEELPEKFILHCCISNYTCNLRDMHFGILTALTMFSLSKGFHVWVGRVVTVLDG
jgi:hypothetical protein